MANAPRSTDDPDKDAVRRLMKAARAALSPDQRQAAAVAAATRLLAVPAVAGARSVALYYAHGDELDPAPAFAMLVRRGVRVAYPCVIRGQRELYFAWVADLDTLVPGAFGICQPPSDAPPVTLADIDAFVVPGLAFDPAGRRLGWGRGHYDATLALRPEPTWIGYGYDAQIAHELPARAHDRSMNFVVTDLRILDPANRVQ